MKSRVLTVVVDSVMVEIGGDGIWAFSLFFSFLSFSFFFFSFAFFSVTLYIYFFLLCFLFSVMDGVLVWWSR